MTTDVKMPVKRSERILKAIERELRAREQFIDSDPNLSSVSLIVGINDRTGQPCTVRFRTEGKVDL